MPFLKASCSTFTTAGSIPFGPPMPNGEFDTMLIPLSFSVGTSGQFLVRSAPHVTSRRNLPALTSSAQPVESAVASMCPPNVAFMLSAPPLNGTCVHLMPLSLAICSMVMCRLEPAPRRAVIHFAGIGARVLDHVVERLERRVCPHHHAERVAGEVDDVGEILRRIERRLLNVGNPEHADRKLCHGVAVRPRTPRHVGRAKRAGGARSVLDHD